MCVGVVGGGSIPYTLTTPSARCNPVNHPGSYSLLCARLSLGLQARTTNLLNIVRVGHFLHFLVLSFYNNLYKILAHTFSRFGREFLTMVQAGKDGEGCKYCNRIR